jgi:uncharacterized protein YqiB (DUF1249 family)
MVEVDSNNELARFQARIPAIESVDAEITEKLSEKRQLANFLAASLLKFKQG